MQKLLVAHPPCKSNPAQKAHRQHILQKRPWDPIKTRPKFGRKNENSDIKTTRNKSSRRGRFPWMKKQEANSHPLPANNPLSISSTSVRINRRDRRLPRPETQFERKRFTRILISSSLISSMITIMKWFHLGSVLGRMWRHRVALFRFHTHLVPPSDQILWPVSGAKANTTAATPQRTMAQLMCSCVGSLEVKKSRSDWERKRTGLE